MCEERDRLLDAYNGAIAGALKLGKRLADSAGKTSAHNLFLLSKEKMRATTIAKEALAAYRKHVMTHGCASNARQQH
jgi:hypothetical protein